MIGHILYVFLLLSIPPLLLLPPGKKLHGFARTRKRSTGKGGFTIVELVVAVAIIAILAAIAIPAYTNYVDRSQVKLTVKNIRLLEQAIKTFEFENMRLPNTLNELGPIEMLEENGNSVTRSPPFLDPYGNAYRYLNFANEPPGWPNCRTDQVDKPLSLDYDLYSMGADGVTQKKLNHPNSLDDIVRARSGKFVDLASKY